VQRTRKEIRPIAKKDAIDEVCVIFPFARRAVASTIGYGHAKVEDVHSALGGTNLWITGKVT
jgi:hypothetical protein